MWLGNVQIAKPKLTAKAMRFGVARIRQYVVKLAAIAAAMGVADMNGGPSQKARVLIAVSRSAKVHAEQRRAAMSPERRARHRNIICNQKGLAK